MSTAQPQPAETDAQYYRRVLHHVIDANVAILDKVKADCLDAPPAPTAAEQATANLQAAQACAHLGRTIRRCIMLAQRPAAPAAKPAPPVRDHYHVASKEILVVVGDAINKDCGSDIPRSDRLHAEMHERLESPEIDDAIDNRPIPVIIAELCHALDVPVPPRRPAPPPPNPHANLTDDELADEVVAQLRRNRHHPNEVQRT